MSDKYNLQTLSGSISIGKGDKGDQGPVGPQGPIGDNNVCVGTSPTDEAEIWFDTSSDGGGEAVATLKELQKVDQRVSEIIASNGGGVKDNEIIDAREGEICLGDKIRKISSTLDTKANKSEVAKVKEIANTWETFKNNGGDIGGAINFPLSSKINNITKPITITNNTMYYRENVTNNNGFSHISRFEDDSLGDKVNQNGIEFRKNYGETSGSFRPMVDNALDLGSSNYKWKNIYLSGVSKSKNGYTKLPNGLIMQWGTWVKTATETSSSYTYTINFPTSFPSTCLMVVPYASAFSTKGNYHPQCCASVMSDSSASDFKFKIATTIDIRNELNWIAIGY